MKLLKHFPWAIPIVAVFTWMAIAGHGHQVTPAPVQVTSDIAQVCEGGYSIAPSPVFPNSSLEPVTFCPCLPGTNCCGNSGCAAGSCGKMCQCHCDETNHCTP